MSKFKAGQRVWSVLDGWGTVVRCEGSRSDYLILVKHDNGDSDQYTEEGNWRKEDLRPILFLDEPKEWPDPPAPIPDMPIDTPLWCKNREGAPWLPVHFAGVKDGKVSVFSWGLTSHTGAPDATFVPYEWSLTKPISKETTDAN